MFADPDAANGTPIDKFDGLYWSGAGEHDAWRGAPLGEDVTAYARAGNGQDPWAHIATNYAGNGTSGAWARPGTMLHALLYPSNYGGVGEVTQPAWIRYTSTTLRVGGLIALSIGTGGLAAGALGLSGFGAVVVGGAAGGFAGGVVGSAAGQFEQQGVEDFTPGEALDAGVENAAWGAATLGLGKFAAARPGLFAAGAMLAAPATAEGSSAVLAKVARIGGFGKNAYHPVGRALANHMLPHVDSAVAALAKGHHAGSAAAKTYHKLAQLNAAGKLSGKEWLVKARYGKAVEEIAWKRLQLDPAFKSFMKQYKISYQRGSFTNNLNSRGNRVFPDFQVEVAANRLGRRWGIIDITTAKQAPKIDLYNSRRAPFMINVTYPSLP